MKKTIKEEMRSEYDFSGKKGVRGKYYQAIKDGYMTIVHKTDGSTETTETKPIFLEHDLRERFPNSQAVNKALRELVGIKGLL